MNTRRSWIGLLATGWFTASLLNSTHPAVAAAFSSPNNLVVIRLGTGNDYTPFAAQSLHLDEYNISGAAPVPVQSIDLPSSGASAVTLPDSNNHDGILNLSADGHYLVFGSYRADVGLDSPQFTSSTQIPRVVVRVAANGTVDTSTALTDGSYTITTIRAVATDNGTRFWVAGDNADNEQCCSTHGGLRYVASLGANSSVNLSHQQAGGMSPTPDNVRDVGIVNGQLYDASGSSSSIGKAVLQVGTGLPTATVDSPQSLTALTTDGASTNAFFFADLYPAVDGVDTLYTSTSAQGDGIHKYSKVFNGTSYNWVSNGFAGLIGIEAMTATVTGSNVTVYTTTGTDIYRWTDTSGYNVPISGSVGTSILTAGENESFRGLAFAPSAAAAGLPGDYNANGKVDAADYVLWRNSVGTSTVLPNDPMGGIIGLSQYNTWRTHFGNTATGLGGSAEVPEPSSSVLLLAAVTSAAIARRR